MQPQFPWSCFWTRCPDVHSTLELVSTGLGPYWGNLQAKFSWCPSSISFLNALPSSFLLHTGLAPLLPSVLSSQLGCQLHEGWVPSWLMHLVSTLQKRIRPPAITHDCSGVYWQECFSHFSPNPTPADGNTAQMERQMVKALTSTTLFLRLT